MHRNRDDDAEQQAYNRSDRELLVALGIRRCHNRKLSTRKQQWPVATPPVVLSDGLYEVGPDHPERVSDHATASENGPRGAITCSGCDNWWTGLNSAHCSACHTTFTGIGGFDMHRRDYQCLQHATIGLIPADREWEGWQRPGTWTGPIRSPERTSDTI